jgi:repressor LexA
MFWNNFVALCVKHNTKPNPVAKALELSSGSVTKWKNGATPNDTTLKKIADYFGVTVEDLKADSTPTPKPEPNAAINLDTSHIHMIPVYESASAGFGTVADNFIVEYMPLYVPNVHEAAETICIKVTGDSMYPKIEDGDIIQVHRQTSVDSGSIAVVIIDEDEALVKRIEYGPNHVSLISINPLYPPIIYKGADVLRLKIVGLVRKIIKSV